MAEANAGQNGTAAMMPALPDGSEAARARRKSPLAGVGVAQLALLPQGMSACEVPFLVMADVRVGAGSSARAAVEKALGVPLPEANSFVTAGERQIVWVGPDEWLVVGPDGDDDLLPSLEAAVEGEFAAIVDVSGQRTTIDLSGGAVRELLSHGLAMDLHPSKAPTGTAATTVLALAGVTLLVVDDGGSVRSDSTVVRLLVRSSFARYLADWLADASLEYRASA